jgi:hypothetical protein
MAAAPPSLGGGSIRTHRQWLCASHREAATASRCCVLRTGWTIASGSCADLRQDERVKQAYLGQH